MASFNKVLLMGNLTKDPELRYTPGGSAVTDFGLAINRTYSSASGEKKDETCFVEITVWAKQAESVSKYLQKGSPAFIEGRLQLDQWEDKETGKSRSRLKVVAERVQFIGGAKGGENDNYQNVAGNPGTYSSPQNPPSVASQSYRQTAAPNVPPPMPSPSTVPVPSVPAPDAAPPVIIPASVSSAPPRIPKTLDNAFDPSSEVEDDIPF